jgi:hypothetical protein
LDGKDSFESKKQKTEFRFPFFFSNTLWTDKRKKEDATIKNFIVDENRQELSMDNEK